jgi:uncharacterized protein YfaS (alpha-2-macroglobulin family)
MQLRLLSAGLVSLWLGSIVAPSQAASPIAVRAAVGPEVVSPGDVTEAQLIVENTTATATVTVQIEGVITYADGTADQVTRVKRRGGLTLEPGQGFELNLLLLVPADAALGDATITATVKVTKLTGGSKRLNASRPFVSIEEAVFEVVEP